MKKADQLLHAVAGEAERQLRSFNAQNMANTVWAFATAKVEAPSLFAAVAEIVFVPR